MTKRKTKVVTIPKKKSKADNIIQIEQKFLLEHEKEFDVSHLPDIEIDGFFLEKGELALEVLYTFINMEDSGYKRNCMIYSFERFSQLENNIAILHVTTCTCMNKLLIGNIIYIENIKKKIYRLICKYNIDKMNICLNTESFNILEKKISYDLIVKYILKKSKNLDHIINNIVDTKKDNWRHMIMALHIKIFNFQILLISTHICSLCTHINKDIKLLSNNIKKAKLYISDYFLNIEKKILNSEYKTIMLLTQYTSDDVIVKDKLVVVTLKYMFDVIIMKDNFTITLRIKSGDFDDNDGGYNDDEMMHIK